MIKFSNLYKLISEGLYITDDNKYDYHPVDKFGDIILNHPTSRFYSNLPYNQSCFISYIIPETFSMPKVKDKDEEKSQRKDQRISLYHTLKQYYSIDYTPDIPTSSDENIINLSNIKERDIKAPIRLEYINRLFDASISNFIFRFKNIKFDLILTPTSHSKHVNMFLDRFKQYIEYNTQYSTIQKISSSDLKIQLTPIKQEFPSIKSILNTSFGITNSKFFDLLKTIKHYYNDNNSLGIFANNFIKDELKKDNNNFYILLSILIWVINHNKDDISLNKHIKGNFDTLLINARDKVLNSLNTDKLQPISNIAFYCKNLTKISIFKNIKNILILDDNVNDGTTIKTDGSLIREKYPNATITWFVLIGDSNKLNKSPIFKEIKHHDFYDIFHKYDSVLYANHKEDLKNIVLSDKKIEIQKFFEKIANNINDYKLISQNRDNVLKCYSILNKLYKQFSIIYDNELFKLENIKIETLFNNIPQPDTIKNQNTRTIFYEQCNRFYNYILSLDYINNVKYKYKI